MLTHCALMRFYKPFFCLFIFILLCSQKVDAQFLIKGKIMGSDGQPVEMAEVVLLKKDSVALVSKLSDVNGKFELNVANGDYLFNIRLLGQMLHRQMLQVTDHLDLGTISIENARALKEIVVTGKKPLFESRADRFVFNIENSSLSIGNNTWDVLRQTPLLQVEQEKLSIVGAQNATVYINDRKSILRGKDLYQYLRSMPSDNIVRIEIITSPSAKYDASDGAIINLVLKKTDVDGFKGIITLTDEQKRGNSPGGNFNLNYHHRKYSQNASFYLGQTNSKTTEDLQNTDFAQQSQALINSVNKADEFRIGATTAINYEATENSIIGAVFEFQYYNPNDVKSTINSFINAAINPYGSENINDGNVQMAGGSIFYSLKGKDKSSFDLSLDYFSHNRKNNNKFSAFPFGNPMNFSQLTDIDNNIDKNNYAFKVDYSKALGKSGMKMETGFKVNLLRTKSPYIFSEWNGNALTYNPLLSNDFDYKENINSAYLTLQRRFFKKMDVLIGIRYENTDIKTILNEGEENNSSQANDFLPSLNANYVFNKSHRLSLGYRSMLWRPYSNELNPFIFRLNENYLVSGNSNLYRARVQALRLNYSFRSSLVMMLSMEQVNNPILNNTEINNGISLTRPENFAGKVRRYYFGINYNLSLLKNRMTANISSGIYKVDNSEIYLNSKNSLYNSSAILINASNLFKAGINLSGYLGYTSSYTLVNKNTHSFLYNTFDISKNFKDYKFKIGVVDPFKLIINQYTMSSSTGILITNADYNQRGLSFSLTRSFGNAKTRKADVEKLDKGRSENGNSNIK